MLARKGSQRYTSNVITPSYELTSGFYFDQHYAAVMPLLLSVLQNAKGSEYHKLRLKAMECAGLVGGSCLFPSIILSFNVKSAIAVGRDVFREDSRKLCELLMQVQSELDISLLKVQKGDHAENRQPH
jgi:hypothetical protein